MTTRTAAADAPHETRAGGASRVRVLVADDDDDIRDVVRDMLELEGYDVKCVATGADMLAYLSSWILDDDEKKRSPADVIVTDVRMPGFNGLNIVEGLRAHGFHQPIVVMTAFSDEAMRERVSRMGAAALVDKPFDPDLFERVVSGLVKRSHI